MTDALDFPTLTELARRGDSAFAAHPPAERIAVTRAWWRAQWDAVRARHLDTGAAEVLLQLSQHADTIIRGASDFATYKTGGRRGLFTRAALCALGGYGRQELSPYSDIDIALVYDGAMDRDIEAFTGAFMPFLWDLGFKVGFAVYEVAEAVELATQDPAAYTTLAQARLLTGDSTTFARLRLLLRDVRNRAEPPLMELLRKRVARKDLDRDARDVYAAEPDVKEAAGGLRDYHAALWLLQFKRGVTSIDAMARLEWLSPEDHLALVESLDMIWRIRNELHFHTGRAQDKLTFALQSHLARTLGYLKAGSNVPLQVAIDRLMRDYYEAAGTLANFLAHAAALCDPAFEAADTVADAEPRRTRSGVVLNQGCVCAGMHDAQWFAEYPPRLMEIFWECARHSAPPSQATLRRVRDNLILIDEGFRGNSIVRRFFLAVCSRPLQAGFALRHAAAAGVLGRYLPEFDAVGGIVRYEDFHSYPVDEHTLRAIEALRAIPDMEGPVGSQLEKALEHIRDPYILVLSILLHDLGKAEGEEHVEAGVQLVADIAARIGLSDPDRDRVAFLVRHHMLMTHLSMYRDTDDPETIRQFADTMKTDDRLRELLLLSYCDLSAVGPNVWTDWKGALLLKLYRKTERLLRGDTNFGSDAAWIDAKIQAVTERLPEAERAEAEAQLHALDERYLVAFNADRIVDHHACVAEARAQGVALHSAPGPAGVTELVVCTNDRPGLIALLTGVFTAELIDVQAASLFTTPDGMAIDCFDVVHAGTKTPLTEHQLNALEATLRKVLIDGVPVAPKVDAARRRLFALLQPHVPVATHIAFDNGSSQTHTVIDLETGDRTGLLYDITRALADAGLDCRTARIMTDARRARDSFYVVRQTCKLEDEQVQAAVRRAIEEAIHGAPHAKPQTEPLAAAHKE